MDRRSRTEHESRAEPNVDGKEIQPQAAPQSRVGFAGRNRPAEVGGGEHVVWFGDREEPSSHQKEEGLMKE